MTSELQNLLTTLLLAFAVAAVGVGLAVTTLLMSNRLDDLEQRITTFETVRIEYVAPTDDSG